MISEPGKAVLEEVSVVEEEAVVDSEVLVAAVLAEAAPAEAGKLHCV